MPSLTPHTREFFYVGGKYVELKNSDSGGGVGGGDGHYMTGQIYVERLVPHSIQNPCPIVFIAGGAQTGTNFINTPDGRPGWADYFLARGHEVYLTDQTQRGRSPWVPGLADSGELRAASAAPIEQLFCATAQNGNLWPQAGLHTQWPGPGTRGDPVFDAFFASQVQLQGDQELTERMNADAYTALVDRIVAEGTARDGDKVAVVLLTHSQSGPYGWIVADRRPDAVRAVVACEPVGPAFENAFPFPGRPRRFGITSVPIEYDPPAGDDGALLKTTVREAPPELQQPGPGRLQPCELQAEGAVKRLRNLSAVRVLVVTGEASYHAPYEWGMVEYLRQAGVPVEWMDLGRKGVRGNGHMLMLEKNSDQIAGMIEEWVVGLAAEQLAR